MDTELHFELTKPFEPKLIKWRIGARNKDKTKGIALAYVDARDVMQRLDRIVGTFGWQDRQPRAGYCELTIEGITKSDCAGETQVEAEKGQSSDAFKRAAVKFGIGRYLYYLPNTWVELDNGYLPRNFQGKLPDWALPQNWTKYYSEMF